MYRRLDLYVYSILFIRIKYRSRANFVFRTWALQRGRHDRIACSNVSSALRRVDRWWNVLCSKRCVALGDVCKERSRYELCRPLLVGETWSIEGSSLNCSYIPLLLQIAETTDLLHQPIELDRKKFPTSSLRLAWGRSAENSCTASLTKAATTAMVTTRQTSTIPYHKSTRILTSNCPFMDSGLITPGYVFSNNRQAGLARQ